MHTILKSIFHYGSQTRSRSHGWNLKFVPFDVTPIGFIAATTKIVKLFPILNGNVSPVKGIDLMLPWELKSLSIELVKSKRKIIKYIHIRISLPGCQNSRLGIQGVDQHWNSCNIGTVTPYVSDARPNLALQPSHLILSAVHFSEGRTEIWMAMPDLKAKRWAVNSSNGLIQNSSL